MEDFPGFPPPGSRGFFPPRDCQLCADPPPLIFPPYFYSHFPIWSSKYPLGPSMGPKYPPKVPYRYGKTSICSEFKLNSSRSSNILELNHKKLSST